MRRLPLALFFCLAAATSAAAQPLFDPERAWKHLEAQCAFGPRIPGTAGHEGCLGYLERSLRESGGDVARLAFRAPSSSPASAGGRADSVSMTNLRARFGGAGAPLLLGAHWDTRPWADREKDPARRDEPILGANDGASGVAVLLAIADLLGRQPPPIPVEIVLFDGEDQGREGDFGGYCLGSRAYARALPAPWPRAAVILDLVGGRDLHICREGHSEQGAPWLNDLLFGRARDLGLAGFEDRVCYDVYDDHIAFLELGVPAVDLVDMHFPQWHTRQDTPGVCSPESLRQLGDLMVDLIYGGSLQ